MRSNSTSGTKVNFGYGDAVIVLYQGRYNGMSGRFIGLGEDPNWADIEERDGSVRRQPVLWLRHPEALAAAPGECLDSRAQPETQTSGHQLSQ